MGAKLNRAQKEAKMMMKRNPLPKNADELLAPGEAVAAVLPENQKQWDIPTGSDESSGGGEVAR